MITNIFFLIFKRRATNLYIQKLFLEILSRILSVKEWSISKAMKYFKCIMRMLMFIYILGSGEWVHGFHEIALSSKHPQFYLCSNWLFFIDNIDAFILA